MMTMKTGLCAVHVCVCMCVCVCVCVCGIYHCVVRKNYYGAHCANYGAECAPSFSGRKIEDLIRCETRVYRQRIQNVGEKLI